MAKQPKGSTGKRILTLTHNALPASMGFVKEVRSELIAKMDSVRFELRSEIHGVKADVHDLKSEIHGIKSEIHEIKSEIHEIKSEIHGVKSEVNGLKSEVQHVLVAVHRTQALMEEQRSENRIVLDGLKNVMERQDRMESDLREVRDTVRTLTRVSN